MNNKPRFIEMVECELSPVFYQSKWWDKPRWWLVRLLGGRCPHDYVKVTRIPIDGDFVERLFKQRAWITDHLSREPKTLLIGAEDYEQIMNCPQINHRLRFDTSYMFGNRQIIGLTVEIIPWMRGMVVMP